MKKAFTLLELIFAIVIIAIIASFAVPKYINTKNYALASTIKRDLISVVSSIQTHYLINRKIEKISEAVNINSTNWKIEDDKIIFIDSSKSCLELSTSGSKILITIDEDSSSVCEMLFKMGVENQEIDLL